MSEARVCTDCAPIVLSENLKGDLSRSVQRPPIYSSSSSDDDSFDEDKGQKRLMKAKKLDSDEVNAKPLASTSKMAGGGGDFEPSGVVPKPFLIVREGTTG